MADGHSNKCKECVKSYHKVQRKDPAARAQIRKSDRLKFEHYLETGKAVAYQRKARAANPAKYKARHLVSNALRNGRLVREPCEVCGSLLSQAHVFGDGSPVLPEFETLSLLRGSQ